MPTSDKIEGLCPEAMQWCLWLSLHEALHYNPDTGLWTWKKNKKGYAAVGRPAGSIAYIHGVRRRFIKFEQKHYFAYRLAWFYITMEWPKEIDHINRNSLDDRWVNLREVTHAENIANSSLRNNPVTGRFEREDHPN
jgi:HNH endonuclease